MKMNMKKTIAIILAVLTVMASGALLTGCGEDTKATEATAATETAKATDAATTAVETAPATEAAQQQDADSGQDNNSAADADGYIDQATAVANVRSLVGSGAEIISVEKGYTPDGFEAWVIVVAPVTNSDGPETVTYYSGYQFCYAAANDTDADSANDNDPSDYIDQAEAVANVRSLAGSGAEIISVEKGYTPEGFKAWVIVVAPVTSSDGPETVTYYSGYQFCYIG